jgi:hypothetical protein
MKRRRSHRNQDSGHDVTPFLPRRIGLVSGGKHSIFRRYTTEPSARLASPSIGIQTRCWHARRTGAWRLRMKQADCL